MQEYKEAKFNRHLKNEFLKLQFNCQFCKENFNADEFMKHKEIICPNISMYCPFCNTFEGSDDSSKAIKLSELRNHLEQECPRVEYNCSWCRMKVFKEDLEAHKRIDCLS